MSTLQDVSRVVVNCIRSGGKVLIFGVGGNAATASHFAAELAGKYEEYEDPLPVVCLNDNTSIITAITNDFGWVWVFSRQIRGLGKEGDVVIGFTISGKGTYLTNALRAAKDKRCTTVLLSGEDRPWEGRRFSAPNYLVSVGHTDTPRVQEEQLRWVHKLSGLIKSSLE